MKIIKKSILFKLLLINTMVILGIVGISSVLNYYKSSEAIRNEIETQLDLELEMLTQKIVDKQDSVESEMKILLQMNALRNFETDLDAATAVIENYGKSRSDLVQTAYIVGTDGIVVADNFSGQVIGTDLSSRDYFITSIKGENYWSEVLVSAFTGDDVQVISEPIKSTDDQIIGVLCMAIDFQVFRDYILDVQVGESGYAYLIDSQGVVIAHPVTDYLGKTLESFGIEELSAHIPAMTSGETHEVEYTYNKITKLNKYSPIGTWSLSINAANSEFLAPVKELQIDQMITGFIFFILGSGLIAYSSMRIVKRIKSMNNAMNNVAQGDLTTRVNQGKQVEGDEIDQMGNALNTTVEQLQGVVDAIKVTSLKLASSSQQLSASSQENQSSAEETASRMSIIAEDIDSQTHEIDSTFNLYETLSAGINRSKDTSDAMATSTKEVKDAATHGSDVVSNAKVQMESIQETSEKTVHTINNLLKQSDEIGSINEMISQIADQTNLLALNAAIEAARAGEQGKGFAVVADEIRKLAAQSQESAHGIQTLINELQSEITTTSNYITEENEKVEIGLEAVQASEVALTEISVQVETVGEMIGAMDDFIHENFDTAEKVNTSLNIIVESANKTAANTQTVAAANQEQTAVSEEIASAAMELTAMADNLINKVNHFKTDNLEKEESVLTNLTEAIELG